MNSTAKSFRGSLFGSSWLIVAFGWLAGLGGIGAIGGGVALADPIYELRTQLGEPLTVRGFSILKNPNNTYTGLTTSAGHISLTADGKLFAYDNGSGAIAYILLDPAITARTTLANDPGNNAGLIGVSAWGTSVNTSTIYAASALDAPVIGTRLNVGGSLGSGGISRATAMNSHFSWSTDGGASVSEIQFQDTAGNFDTSAGYGARLGTSSGISTADFKRSIDWISETSDVYQMIGLRGGTHNATQVFKFELGALTGLDVDSRTQGTRTVLNGATSGYLTQDGHGGTASAAALALINDLVPGISDNVSRFRYHEPTNRLFFASDDGANVYLSAVTVADWGTYNTPSVATYVDLDPDSANNYLSFSYDSGTPATSLLSARGLAIDDDTGTIYIMGGGQRIFIVDPVAAVPEPSTLALLGLGGAALLVALRKRRARLIRR